MSETQTAYDNPQLRNKWHVSRLAELQAPASGEPMLLYPQTRLLATQIHVYFTATLTPRAANGPNDNASSNFPNKYS
jgi:hypothetical protein